MKTYLKLSSKIYSRKGVLQDRNKHATRIHRYMTGFWSFLENRWTIKLPSSIRRHKTFYVHFFIGNEVERGSPVFMNNVRKKDSCVVLHKYTMNPPVLWQDDGVTRWVHFLVGLQKHKMEILCDLHIKHVCIWRDESGLVTDHMCRNLEDVMKCRIWSILHIFLLSGWESWIY